MSFVTNRRRVEVTCNWETRKVFGDRTEVFSYPISQPAAGFTNIEDITVRAADDIDNITGSAGEVRGDIKCSLRSDNVGFVRDVSACIASLPVTAKSARSLWIAGNRM